MESLLKEPRSMWSMSLELLFSSLGGTVFMLLSILHLGPRAATAIYLKLVGIIIMGRIILLDDECLDGG